MEYRAASTFGHRLVADWRAIWLAIALIAAAPALYFCNQSLLQTKVDLEARLIVQNSLWESDPSYRGSPRDWTRFAAWLLESEQLLERVRALHPGEADTIEEDYHRDTLLAFSTVILHYVALWGIPVALLFGAGLWAERRRMRRSA